MYFIKPLRRLACVHLKRGALGVVMLAGCGAGAHAEPWRAECKLSLAASLPFRFERGHIRVEVRVNDVPRTFILDTGGFLSSIGADVVEKQKIRTREINEGMDITGLGGGRAKHYAIADALTFGQLQAKDVRLIVQPADSDGEEDGVIGPEYLRNFDVEIDFAKKVVNLFRPHPCPGLAVYWSAVSDSTELVVTPQGHIRADLQLDGKTIPAMLDTGSPASLISNTSVSSEVREDKSPEAVTLFGATGASSQTLPHRFQGLKLGSLLIANPTLLVSWDQDTFLGDHVGMLIGNRELRLFYLYIAYREHRLYFTPN